MTEQTDIEALSRNQLIGIVYDLQDRIDTLTNSNEILILGLMDKIGLTKTQSMLVASLLSGRPMTRYQLMAVISRDPLNYACEKIITVHVRHIRSRGVDVSTVWGKGYQLSPETIAKIKQTLEAA